MNQIGENEIQKEVNEWLGDAIHFEVAQRNINNCVSPFDVAKIKIREVQILLSLQR